MVTKEKKPRVVSRIPLQRDLIISVNLLGKKLVHVKTSDEKEYEYFSRAVRGGKVSFHIFDYIKCRKFTNKMWVEAQVWKKVFANGEEVIYIDLFPTEKDLTHVIKKYRSAKQMPQPTPQGTLTFSCYEGMIAFVPRNS